jgi:upstream activation factor subunit UAF30
VAKKGLLDARRIGHRLLLLLLLGLEKMVSDAEIVKHLISVLKTADLATTTTTAIRQQLEQDLRVDLSDKKAFIRQQVDLYLQHQHSQKEEENEREDGEGEQQEEENEEESEENEDDAEEEQDEDDYVKQVARGVSDSKQQQQRLRHAKIRRSSKESLPKEKKKRTGGAGGLNKLCSLSPELQAVVGETELPRTQVVKQLWAYIRENGLQDPENKRKIICNEELRNLFGIDSTDMFKMNKLLSKHIWPLENGSSVVASTNNAEPRPKKPKLEKSEGARGRSSGFLAPIPISEGLAKFLGAEDGKVSRADAVKRIWDYIKENNLQDPANKKMIVCDSKLQELFECDTFVGFGITKLLSPHFLKA